MIWINHNYFQDGVSIDKTGVVLRLNLKKHDDSKLGEIAGSSKLQSMIRNYTVYCDVYYRLQYFIVRIYMEICLVNTCIAKREYIHYQYEKSQMNNNRLL